MNKVKNFTYKKKEGAEEKEVFTLNENDRHIVGIDLSKLSEEEKIELFEASKEYEEKIAPFVKKGFRKYLKENMVFPESEEE